MTNARILIVEDEASHAMDLKYRVETLGYHVLGIVDTGHKAVEFVKRYRPDLVLMDIGLNGEVDGIAAAREIWNQTRTPFVYITAYSEESLATRTDAVEPYGFVGKPFYDRELQRAIELALYKAAVESSVRQRERMLETFVGSLRDGAIGIDKNSRITYMNPIAEVLTGWKANEAHQQEVGSVLRAAEADTQQELSICIGIVLREGGALTVSDIALLTRKGGSENVDATITALRNVQGQLEGAAILLHDTSRRQRAEREQGLQKQFFRQLFDRSPEAIAILDSNDCILDINQAFTELFLYSPSEVKGSPINTLIVPQEYSCEAEALSKEAHAQATVKAEGLRRRKDGTTVPVSILAAPIMVSEYTMGVLAIYREIADKQRWTTALHQQMKVVEQFPIPTVVTDVAGNVAFINRRFAEITGHTLKETVGKNFRLLPLKKASRQVDESTVLVLDESKESYGGLYTVAENAEPRGEPCAREEQPYLTNAQEHNVPIIKP